MTIRNSPACTIVLAMCALAACSKKDPPRQPTIPVSVTTVKRSTVPFVVTANGVAEPMQTVAVEAQVNGILNASRLRKAQNVQAGQVLFQIDARPYVAALEQARGTAGARRSHSGQRARDAARYAALVKKAT